MIFKAIFFLYQHFLQLTWLEQTSLVILFTWCALLTFYTLYIGAINVIDNYKSVSYFTLSLTAPLVISMVVTDFLMNMTLFTLLTLDFPREFLVTQRLIRYRAQVKNDWRQRMAVYICNNFLNPFDPTKHHC